jgi:hypothetical protein
LILNPRDREIIQQGKFVFHPEYVHALAQQGLVPDPSLLLERSTPIGERLVVNPMGWFHRIQLLKLDTCIA